MKSLRHLILAVAVILGFASRADAQYVQIANAIPSIISPALSGSVAYKGFVELSGIAGIGETRCNFVELSTSQGFRYASWFFMGVGIGIDAAIAPETDVLTDPGPNYYPGTTRTACMIPVFTDFRFNIGPSAGLSAYLGAKVGAAWLLGDDYLSVNYHLIGHGTQFYFQPSVGVRIPVSSSSQSQAVNIGLTYRLLTSNNGWRSMSTTLNGIGASISFEW
ncbi:MAG: hypothetical protein NC336_08770 [Clostridium sp.]|nr:hypothetical protein [Clostridium sp.]